MMQVFGSRDTLFIVRGGETGGDWQIRPDMPGYHRSLAVVYTRTLPDGHEIDGFDFGHQD
jgi:hypothetical protein